MTHLAIGDFVFQGVYLEALKQHYPDLQLDIWIDDCRNRTKSWHAGRNDTLNQWLASLSFIGKVYPIAGSSSRRNELIKEARERDYDLVFFIATQRTEEYARIARKIGHKATVVGTRFNPLQKGLRKHFYFRQLDGYVDIEKLPLVQDQHISMMYQQRFEACVGELFPSEPLRRQLALHIPPRYSEEAQQWVTQQRMLHQRPDGRIIFINHLSTTRRRDYPLIKLREVLLNLHQKFNDMLFVINVPPAALDEIRVQLAEDPQLSALPVIPFTASQHFYQLPALIQQSHMVISVETAVMHLASTLNVPQLVMMREHNPEWQPVNASGVLFGERYVSDIAPETVVRCAKDLCLAVK